MSDGQFTIYARLYVSEKTIQASYLSPEDMHEKIIASQMDRDQKISKADDVIVNDGEIGDLISKIDKIHQRYIELADG